ncbi:MAG: three component ABC system middle component [Pseudoruegeria sp.]
MLEVWRKRPTEEANLFNPAFLGSLLYEQSKEYLKHTSLGLPLTYASLCISVVLHGPTRDRLPYSTVTSLYEWLQDNEDVQIGLAARVQGVQPYLKEALRFGLRKNILVLSNGHSLIIGEVKAHFPAGFIRDTTAETKEIIDRNKFMARWFAKSGSEASVIAAWGLRP